MKNFKLKSPAKVNLLLKILGKNQDNYHELEMLTALTSMHDTIKFTLNNKDFDLVTDISFGNHVPKFDFNKENNSIISALNLIRKKFNISNFFDISIQKNIPAGGGLGGGSSNAASILSYFAKHFKQNPADVYLPSEIKAISSDIFCFINEYPLIYQSGIGDIVSKATYLGNEDSIEVLLFFPVNGFSTLSMYKNFSASYSYSEATKITKKINLEQLLGLVNNDFLKVVKDLYPLEFNFYSELVNLNQGAVSMSGSGSTFFLIPDSSSLDMEDISKLTEKHCISYINTKILLK